MTCGPWNVTAWQNGDFQLMDVFSFYNLQYGVPNALVLGLFLGILVAGIYLWTRSLNILAILGIYTVSVVSVFATTEDIAPGYEGVMWVIALAITAMVVIFVLKLLRE